MRKNIYKFVAFSFIIGAFLACDNATTDFDGFDEQVEIKNIVRREITMDKSFYSTLVSTISSEDKEAKDFISKNNAYGTFYFRKANAVEAYYRHYQSHCLHL